MSGKQRAQRATASKQDSSAPYSSRANSGAAPDRFRANVFTWTGPGVENIFIDFDPATQRPQQNLARDK
jgi:hypothetical protein